MAQCPFNFQINDHNILQIESMNFTGTNIVDLNDDCLVKIIAMLDLKDLCSLSRTCTLFHWIITQRIIPKEIHLVESFDDEYYIKMGNFSFKTNRRCGVKRIFKNFGSVLHSISISGYSDDFGLKLIAGCCEKKLKSLSISNREISAVGMKPIFKQLHTLHLDYSTVNDDSTDLFAGLDFLVELRVRFVENCDGILRHTFPKLVRFSYGEKRIANPIRYPFQLRPLETILNFISHHPTLKALDLNFACDNDIRKIILQEIVNSCQQELLEITIDVDWMCNAMIRQLKKLTSLKTLVLRGVSTKDFQFFSALDELRGLNVMRWDSTEDFEF